MAPSYVVHRLPSCVWTPSDWAQAAAWSDPVWEQAAASSIDQFHARSSDHRPHTSVRMFHDDQSVLVRFDVDDRYVLSTATEYQSMVCFDSCVEFFFRPRHGGGYFNMEINCGGTLLMYYIENPHRTDNGFEKFTPVRWEDARSISIFHSLPQQVVPERVEPTAWRIGLRIPLTALQPYMGPMDSLDGQSWTANFYKCADRTSHPHWASWSAMGENLNFHNPDGFAPIQFEK